MKANGLTPGREAYAVELAKGSTQAAAYRVAFPRSVNWADATVWAHASRLAADDKVRARVAELQQKAAAANEVTLAQHVAKLAELRDEARAARQFGAAIQAETARGKASGLYTDRVQVAGANGGPLSLRVEFATPKGGADAE